MNIKRYALFMGLVSSPKEDDDGGWDDWVKSSDTLLELVELANKNWPNPEQSMIWWEIVDLKEERLIVSSHFTANEVVFWMKDGTQITVYPEANEIAQRDYHDTRWNDDQLQFCRLLTEIPAALTGMGYKEMVSELADSMDLDDELVRSLFMRAQDQWDKHLQSLEDASDDKPLGANDVYVPMDSNDITVMAKWNSTKPCYVALCEAAKEAIDAGSDTLIVNKTLAQEAMNLLSNADLPNYKGIITSLKAVLNPKPILQPPLVKDVDPDLEALLAEEEAIEAQLHSGWQLTLTDYGDVKITCIKVVREITDMGLLEAKQLVESAPCVVATGSKNKMWTYQGKFPIGASTSVDPVDTKTVKDVPGYILYSVVLEGFKPGKAIQCIKSVRSVTNLGLMEAKNLVEAAQDGTPQYVLEAVSFDEAKKAQAILENDYGVAFVRPAKKTIKAGS